MSKPKKRKPLDPRAQLAIAIAAPLLLLVVGWMMLISPQRSKASDLKRQVAEAQTQFQTMEAQLLHAPKPVPLQVADLFGTVRAMPDQLDMPGIILQLNEVAAASGITFDSIQPQGTPINGTGYSYQQINLGFTGNYYALSDFLYRLRNLVTVRGGKLDATGRLFSVEDLTFGEAKTQHFPYIDAQLTVDAYVYGTTATTAPPPAPTGTDTSATTTTSTDTTATTTTTAATPTAAPASTGVNG